MPLGLVAAIGRRESGVDSNSSRPMVSLDASMAALSTAFFSSRTLPGQGSSVSQRMACGAMPLIFPSLRRLKSAMNASTSAGMSSRRSRSGGTTIVTTLSR